MATRTALITGSTSGIGLATAKALAPKGWHIILHGSTEAKCQRIRTELIQETGNQQVDFVAADLFLMAEVHKMCTVVRERFPQLNVLILNAGTFHVERMLTDEGLERTWAVNYLSRFLLTDQLLDTLKVNAPSRIVDVSGMYHSRGKIHFEDLTLEQDYSMSAANSQSKLANVLFTKKLARELAGTGVSINTLHPGAVNTGSFLRAEGFTRSSKFFYRLMSPFFKTPEKGAATSVYLASSPEVQGVSGEYFVNSHPKESAKQTYDTALQDRLWEMSMERINAYKNRSQT